MSLRKFKALVEAAFGLKFDIYKPKLAYDMIIWQDDKSDGVIGGPFAGHSHHCKIPYIERHGWCYAYHNGEWWLLRDGQNGWRNGKANPFPQFKEDLMLTTW